MSRGSTILNAVKPLVPSPIKQRIKSILQERLLRGALRKITDLPPGTLPSKDLLEELQQGWSNEGMAAQNEYLEAVVRHALNADGPILECGSGLTTLLLGLFAGNRGIDVWTLENSAEWHRRMSDTLQENGIRGVKNCLAPLKDYGPFAWYDAPLSTMPSRFSLVVCDGPPGTTTGGRYGLVPVLKDRLAGGTIILLDDAHRESEKEAVNEWEKAIRINKTFHDESRGEFAVITVLSNE